MLKTIKYRLKPNKGQIKLIEKHFGSNRFIYNWALDKKIKLYQNEKKNITRFQLNNLLPQLKQEYPWLKEINSQSLQASIRHLDSAFTRFFRQKSKFPKFKSKKSNKNSFEIPANIKINYDNWTITVPKIKDIKFFKDKKIDNIKLATITKSKTNKYYISVIYDDGKEKPKKPKIKNAVGIDLGVNHFITKNDGTKIDNPKYYYKKLKRLKKLQKDLSRKKKGGNNRQKAIFNLAKQHEKVSNQRNDFLHKVSYELTHENQVNTICMETLDVKNMLKHSYKNLSRNISDCGWSIFNNYMNYKCDWYGKNLLRIGQFEPSSKLCSCGHINNDLKLSDRTWTCQICGKKHDRDVLAANNIKNIALNKKNLIGQGMAELKPVEICNSESMKQEPHML